jgi:hypothetical protein
MTLNLAVDSLVNQNVFDNHQKDNFGFEVQRMDRICFVDHPESLKGQRMDRICFVHHPESLKG